MHWYPCIVSINKLRRFEYNFLTGKAPTMCSCPIYFGIHLCTHWWKHIQEVDLKVVYLFHSPHLRHFIGLQSIYTLIKLQQKCQIYISGSVQYQITYIFCNIIFFHKEFYRAQWRPFFYHKDVHGTYKNKVELSLTLFQQSTSDWEHQR